MFGYLILKKKYTINFDKLNGKQFFKEKKYVVKTIS